MHDHLYMTIFTAKVWQRLQRIESLAEQISAAQAANGSAPEGTNLPLNALRHSLNRAARTGKFSTLLMYGPKFDVYFVSIGNAFRIMCSH